MAHPLSIVLLGNTGVGKSASGNTLLGRAAFESRRSFKSVTTRISEETEAVFGRQISVIDTPGILGSEQQITEYCQDLLQKTSCCLFLLVVKIDRFTEEPHRAAETAIRAVGQQGFNRTYLLFTGGDTLDVTLEEFINEDDEGPLPELVSRFEGRYLMFNNRHGGREQVRQLLQKSGSLPRPSSPQQQRRILLFGLSGAGKSSSGNTILGSDRFRSAAGFESVTAECVSHSADVNGRLVTVMDTPGFTDRGISPEQAKNILEALQEARAGFHALVIVVEINRIKADLFLLQQFPKLFGRDASRHTMVLFTHGDKLKGESVDDVINESRPISNLVAMCCGRYSVFDNTHRGNQLQVSKFLGKVEEIVAANKGRCCSFDNTATCLIKPQRIPNKTPLETPLETPSDQRGILRRIIDWFVWLINQIRDYFSNPIENDRQPLLQPMHCL